MKSTEEMFAHQLLAKFFDVVLDEVKTNSRFAEALVSALPQQVVVRIETKRKTASKTTEPPASLTRLMNQEGEQALREFLKKRNRGQLRAIVERQQIPLDASLFDKDKSPESLRDAIVAGVRFRIADRLAAAS